LEGSQREDVRTFDYFLFGRFNEKGVAAFYPNVKEESVRVVETILALCCAKWKSTNR
jgi:hypothetical protein